MNSHIKLLKHHLFAMAITLSVLSLGLVSIAQAQTVTLSGKWEGKEYCDAGGGDYDKEKPKGTASIFINFNSFPFVTATITVPGESPINISGYAFSKSSTRGRFGLMGSNADNALAIEGKYKIKSSTGIPKEIKGDFQNIFNDGVDQCISNGDFKLKD